LPSIKKKINLENHKIFINYEKNKLDISGKGNVKINDKVDSLNYKLIKKNDQYFLSDITNQDQWINTDNLVNHKGKNITSKLQELKEQYKINYSVNFITEQSGG
jgi:hypothetical protein